MKSVRQKILDGSYDPGELPSHPRRPIPVFSFGADLPGSSEYRHYADLLEAHEKRVAEYQVMMDEHAEKQRRLMEVFARDLATEHGILGHPKQDVLYDMCCELAGTDPKGLHAIADWYEKLVVLITPTSGMDEQGT